MMKIVFSLALVVFAQETVTPVGEKSTLHCSGGDCCCCGGNCGQTIHATPVHPCAPAKCAPAPVYPVPKKCQGCNVCAATCYMMPGPVEPWPYKPEQRCCDCDCFGIKKYGHVAIPVQSTPFKRAECNSGCFSTGNCHSDCYTKNSCAPMCAPHAAPLPATHGCTQYCKQAPPQPIGMIQPTKGSVVPFFAPYPVRPTPQMVNAQWPGPLDKNPPACSGKCCGCATGHCPLDCCKALCHPTVPAAKCPSSCPKPAPVYPKPAPPVAPCPPNTVHTDSGCKPILAEPAFDASKDWMKAAGFGDSLV